MVTITNYTKKRRRSGTSNAFEKHKTIMLVFYYFHFSQDSSIKNQSHFDFMLKTTLCQYF